MAFLGLFGKKKKDDELKPANLALGNTDRMTEDDSNINPSQGFGQDELALQGMKDYDTASPDFSSARNPSIPSSPVSQNIRQPSQQYSSEKDYEVLSAKLDALKAILDNINQRLANIERIANQENEKKYY